MTTFIRVALVAYVPADVVIENLPFRNGKEIPILISWSKTQSLQQSHMFIKATAYNKENNGTGGPAVS